MLFCREFISLPADNIYRFGGNNLIKFRREVARRDDPDNTAGQSTGEGERNNKSCLLVILFG